MHLLGCLKAMGLFNGRSVTRLVTGQIYLGRYLDQFAPKWFRGRLPELNAFWNYFLRSEKISSNFFNLGTITARQ